MAKDTTIESKIEVKSTKEGKLYIDPSELFALDSVQELIRKVVQSKALNNARRVAIK
ncbi:MAG: hypothetical protein ORN54_05490 [Cyclobacteriaceae bacterium]|nr:hypothetical protein [Cyclobacteriaceae bacterium]